METPTSLLSVKLKDLLMTQTVRVLPSSTMLVIKTTVRNGRIIVDEPTSLPDGHVVEVCVVTEDGMTDEDRQRLHESIARGIRDGRAGRETDFDSFMDQLDAEP